MYTQFSMFLKKNCVYIYIIYINLSIYLSIKFQNICIYSMFYINKTAQFIVKLPNAKAMNLIS